ncbi:MAG TPA: gamma-glutamyltransferase [Saprospirales bacterium]|nr:gamma-glutamyltransferase [Saprospirales bacterium]
MEQAELPLRSLNQFCDAQNQITFLRDCLYPPLHRIWSISTLPKSNQQGSYCRHGRSRTAHPLATKVGLDILKKGGNAIDAAVAVQFALAVVYPPAGNIGGGGFLIYRDAKGKKVLALDYREKAPAAATENMYQDSLGKVLPNKSRFGVLACGVPGTVDGMWEAQFYHGRLSWGEVVTPAIDLAENGFQITEQEAQNLNAERLTFARNSSLSPAFVKFQDWKAGEWLIQKELAQTLRRIAGDGRDGFYKGATASLIVKEMEKKGGLITLEDLKSYKSVWRTPLEFDWKDMHIITMPPPSSGGIILRQLLGMVGDFPLKSYGFHSAQAVHLMAEAERRAYADRAEHMGDPDFWKVPVKTLTDPVYIKARMADYKADAASNSSNILAGAIKESEETTHYSIVDREGNAVSVTTTLNDSYGSRTVIGGAGFIMNNEMDDFSAKPGAPNLYGAVGGKANAIVPGKRPLSSMTPTIVTKNGKNWLILGTPGGTTIPTSVFQVIVNVAEFGLSLPDAIQGKRFHHQWKPNQISAEEGCFSEEVQAALEKMGHEINVRGPIGRVEGIIRLPDGKWQGVADQRGDDAAAGY